MINLVKVFQESIAVAREIHEGRESSFIEALESAQFETEEMRLLKGAYNQSQKAKILSKIELSNEAAGVLADLSGLSEKFNKVGKKRQDAIDEASALIASWPSKAKQKYWATLEFLSSSGEVVSSTAPSLILPFIASCARDEKLIIQRNEFISLIHSDYKKKGKALPATSPNWPNPFASFIGNLANDKYGCAILEALDAAGRPAATKMTQYRIKDRALPYLVRAS